MSWILYPGTLEHMLVVCPAIDEKRLLLFNFWSKQTKFNHHLQKLLQDMISLRINVLVQFLLDPSVEARVSSNTVSTSLFAISRLPGHLELKFWTFSWSPLNSKFKTVLILIPIIQIDQISTLRRKKQNLKNNIFLNKKSSLEYVIKSLYGSVRVPIGFLIKLKGAVGFWWVSVVLRW